MAKFDPYGKLTDGRSSGYWGRSVSNGLGIHDRVIADFLPDKLLQHNYDHMFTLGLAFSLWQSASDVLSGPLVQCSCFKDTSSQSDIPCLTCYGLGLIPGMVKFGSQNYWVSSIDPGWTLTGIVTDTTNRPNRLQLAPGQTSGTAISATIPISITGKMGPWEANTAAFTRDNGANSTILVQASVDGGVTWFALNLLDTMGPTTTLKFKVTMTRTTAQVKSPMFEMVRARFPYLTDIRGEVTSESVIRIVPTWDVDQHQRTQLGLREEYNGKRFWCMPLNFYLNGSMRDTKQQRILPLSMLESRFGANAGDRFITVQNNYSDIVGTFTSQSFELRRPTQSSTNSGEVYNLIW